MGDILDPVATGLPMNGDRVWPLTRGDEKAWITEYNMEITGWSQNMAGLVECGGWLNSALSDRLEALGWTCHPALDARLDNHPLTEKVPA